MNRLSIFPPDPNTTFFSGTFSTLDILGQESGHQWLAKVGFGTPRSEDLLGRASSHWSFFHDTDASDMEGNKWQDNGNGTFTTIEATARFSPLDQYLMGLRPASEVADFFFIRNPSLAFCFFEPLVFCQRSSPPEIGVTLSGTRQNVTINQIIESEGTRSPSSGFTAVNPTTTWNQAFILLIREGTTAPIPDVNKLDTFRYAWVSYFNTNTDNRGTIDATIEPIISVTPNSLNFGNVAVGSTSDRTFTVKNIGKGTLSGSASASAPFSIVGSSSYSLAANESKTITVRFNPTSRATFLGNATFTGSSVTRQLRGVGVRGFTDDPLVVRTTPIKKVHLTELRTAANEFRTEGGLSPFPFTDPTLTARVTTVKQVHITELRRALREAAASLNKPAPNFPTDPTIVPGQTRIKAAHIKELRDAVRALD